MVTAYYKRMLGNVVRWYNCGTTTRWTSVGGHNWLAKLIYYWEVLTLLEKKSHGAASIPNLKDIIMNQIILSTGNPLQYNMLQLMRSPVQEDRPKHGHYKEEVSLLWS